MLLTSSQVGVAISSVVVFLFTSALFMSGYVLQQKTVANIRHAIRPPPRPTHTYMTVSEVEGPKDRNRNSNGSETQMIEVIRSEGNVDDKARSPIPEIEQVTDEHSLDLEDEPASAPPLVDQEQTHHRPRPEAAQDAMETKPRFSWRSGWRKQDSDVVEPPLESLSRAARRRKIKGDIRKLGMQEEVLPKDEYKPRKLW